MREWATIVPRSKRSRVHGDLQNGHALVTSTGTPLPRHQFGLEGEQDGEQANDALLPMSAHETILVTPQPVKPLPFSGLLPSAQALSWLLVKDPTNLSANEQQTRAFIEQEPSVETISVLTQQFSLLLKERQAEQLEAWLKICAECGIPEIAAFSQGVWRDFSAGSRRA